MQARRDRLPRHRSTETNETTHFAALWGMDSLRYDRPGTDGEPLRFEYAEFQDEAGREVASLSAFTPAGDDGIEGVHALFDLPRN